MGRVNSEFSGWAVDAQLHFLARFALAFAALAATAMPAAAALRLPFHVRQGLILMDGRVNSTPGVFMLDTGETYFRFLLNRQAVPLGPGTALYKMRAASGQVSLIESHSGGHRVDLAGRIQTTAESGSESGPHLVVSDDLSRMQQNVGSRLLGVVGFGFLKHYDFVIDYRTRMVSLFPPSTVSATGMTIRFAPRSPIVPFTLDIGGVSVPAYLDTGGWQSLKAPADVWRKLAGLVVPASPDEKGCIEILHARYGPYRFAISHTEEVVAHETMLTLGYPFLRRYLSIWKPQQGIVTLAPNGDVPAMPPSSCD